MNVIKSVVKCDECSSILQKPVMLSCGSTVCCRHLDNLADEIYLCKSCGNDHHIEANNKMVNRRLEILIQANLENLNFGSEYEKAFDECNQLDGTINDFESLRNDPVHFIKETIGKLKNKTELFREEHKLKIDEKANQILTQLDNYETDCINNLHSFEFKSKFRKTDESITKLKNDIKEWQNTLNDFGANENQWKTIKQNCRQPNVNLKSEIFDLKTQLLINKLNQHLEIVSSFQEIKLTSNTKFKDEFKDILVNFDIENSKIIDNSKMEQLMKLCDISSDKRWRLIYRGSEHGFTAKDFHEKCDNIPNTLTIIKSKCGYIFGGYTSQAWDQSGKYKIGPDAYLFSLVNPQNQPQKLMTQDWLYAIKCLPDCGPAFGPNGNDLCINFRSGVCCSKLGHSYPRRNGLNQFMTQSEKFALYDIDIYQIV